MKAENTDVPPKFNLLAPEGVKPQAHAEQIKAVLLNDGNWYPIVPGSFKLYQSMSKAPAFGPYATFQLPMNPSEHPNAQSDPLAGLTVEVFPATVAGWAFNDGV